MDAARVPVQRFSTVDIMILLGDKFPGGDTAQAHLNPPRTARTPGGNEGESSRYKLQHNYYIYNKSGLQLVRYATNRSPEIQPLLHVVSTDVA